MKKHRRAVPTIQTRSVFQFPCMLGPASDQVEGSEIRVICIGKEIDPWEVWLPSGHQSREEWRK